MVVTLREFALFIALVIITVILYIAGISSPQRMDFWQIFETALALTIIYGIFSLVPGRLMRHQIADDKTRYTVSKVLSIIGLMLIIGAAIRIWIPDPGTLIISFGLIGAGIAIALQDVFRNLAGSVIIILNRTYTIGDRVEIDGNFGDVMDIGIMTTTLMEIQGWVNGDQATGRLTVIPNGKAINTPIHNYEKDHSFIWDEIQVPISYESDWRRAREIILSIVKPLVTDVTRLAETEIEKLGEKYYLPRRDIEPAVYIGLTDNWVSLSVRYVVNVRDRRILRARISQAILEEFEKDEQITIASQTETITVVPKKPVA
ncbi:MAG: mechanosensitive ion channel domain-containing protein [Methanoregulaceae archaeon]